MTPIKPIPYGRQTINQADIDAVVAVLRSDFLTQGLVVPAFEQAVADYCGAAHAVAVNSATSALHLACLALGVGPGDWVWTSPITFVASANCARYCGADVDFVDIDPVTYNLSVACLAEKLAAAEKSGKLPKVVIPVHMAGQPCDMAAIYTLSQQYGFKIIEDASHAIGARYHQTIVGDCTYGDMTVFSFHPVKIITSGEGGMITTGSEKLAHRLQLLRSHGITREASELEDTDQGAWYYEQQSLGFNYRLTDIQAALGKSQLTQLDQWIVRRHQIADRYDEALREMPLILPVRLAHVCHALHLYIVQLDSARTGFARREVFEQLRAAGIGVNVHYIPVHTQPDYRQFGFKLGDFPQSEAYYARCISLPMFAGLTDEQQSVVIRAVRRVLQ